MRIADRSIAELAIKLAKISTKQRITRDELDPAQEAIIVELATSLLAGTERNPYGLHQAEKFAKEKVKPYLSSVPPQYLEILRLDVTSQRASPILEEFLVTTLRADSPETIDELLAKKLAWNTLDLFYSPRKTNLPLLFL